MRSVVSIARGLTPWQAAIVLALAISALRAFYVTVLCPFPLIEDEAHYWEWARRLDWSYYSKGPGIASLIWLMTSVFGESEGAIRLAAVTGGLGTAIGVGGLARELVLVSGQPAALAGRASVYAVACVSMVPLFQVPPLLATIDSPYLACWALASWAGLRAVHRGTIGAWCALGLMIAVGFLFKYTILLLPPGIALFAVLARKQTAAIRPGRVGLCVLLACLGLVPILVWNAQNDWSTVRHLLGHLGLSGGDQPGEGSQAWRYDPAWTLDYLGVQAAGLVFGVPVILLSVWRGLRSPDAPRLGARFALCAAGPILLFYLFVTLFTRPEGNWPIAGHLSLLSLGGWGVAGAMQDHAPKLGAWLSAPRRRWSGWVSPWPESAMQLSFFSLVVAGIIVGVAVARIDVFTPALGTLIGKPLPTERLTGARDIAREVGGVRDMIARATGAEPFIISQHYGRASVLAFYLPERPVVYSASSRTGGRKSQYDLWDDTDLNDLARLGGRNALLLGATEAQWLQAFERIEPLPPLQSDHKKRALFIGYNYHGFPVPEDAR